MERREDLHRHGCSIAKQTILTTHPSGLQTRVSVELANFDALCVHSECSTKPKRPMWEGSPFLSRRGILGGVSAHGTPVLGRRSDAVNEGRLSQQCTPVMRRREVESPGGSPLPARRCEEELETEVDNSVISGWLKFRDNKRMDSMAEYNYYIIDLFMELPHPSYPRVMSVPQSWIKFTFNKHKVAVELPKEDYSVTVNRIRSEDPKPDWRLFIAFVKEGKNVFETAVKCARDLNRAYLRQSQNEGISDEILEDSQQQHLFVGEENQSKDKEESEKKFVSDKQQDLFEEEKSQSENKEESNENNEKNKQQCLAEDETNESKNEKEPAENEQQDLAEGAENQSEDEEESTDNLEGNEQENLVEEAENQSEDEEESEDNLEENEQEDLIEGKDNQSHEKKSEEYSEENEQQELVEEAENQSEDEEASEDNLEENEQEDLIEGKDNQSDEVKLDENLEKNEERDLTEGEKNEEKSEENLEKNEHQNLVNGEEDQSEDGKESEENERQGNAEKVGNRNQDQTDSGEDYSENEIVQEDSGDSYIPSETDGQKSHVHKQLGRPMSNRGGLCPTVEEYRRMMMMTDGTDTDITDDYTDSEDASTSRTDGTNTAITADEVSEENIEENQQEDKTEEEGNQFEDQTDSEANLSKIESESEGSERNFIEDDKGSENSAETWKYDKEQCRRKRGAGKTCNTVDVKKRKLIKTSHSENVVIPSTSKSALSSKISRRKFMEKLMLSYKDFEKQSFKKYKNLKKLGTSLNKSVDYYAELVSIVTLLIENIDNASCLTYVGQNSGQQVSEKQRSKPNDDNKRGGDTPNNCDTVNKVVSTTQLYSDNADRISKETLRYEVFKPQRCLVELLPGCGIYVSEKGLQRCKQIPDNSPTKLARNLLCEIFSDKALKTCTLLGGHDTKPLDDYARRQLMTYVRQYCIAEGWDIDEKSIKNSLAKKLCECSLKNWKGLNNK